MKEAGGRGQEELIILHLMSFGVTVTASCFLPPSSFIPHPSSLLQFAPFAFAATSTFACFCPPSFTSSGTFTRTLSTRQIFSFSSLQK
jgi:hypothetical protein